MLTFGDSKWNFWIEIFVFLKKWALVIMQELELER
jgi:hypothetical protein